jgi:hypothetical protein
MPEDRLTTTVDAVLDEALSSGVEVGVQVVVDRLVTDELS